MRKKRRLSAILLSLAMFLTACGGQGEENKDAGTTTHNKNAVFREEELQFGGDSANIMQLFYANDTVYIEELQYISGRTDEAGEAATEETTVETTDETQTKGAYFNRIITSYDMQGQEKNKILMVLPENSSPGVFTADSKGNIYSIDIIHPMVEDSADGVSKIFLTAYTPEGEEIFQLRLNEEQGADEYYYVNQIFCVNDEKLVIETGLRVEIYDLQGNRIKEIKKENEEGRLVKMGEAEFALLTASGDGSSIQSIDIETGKLGESSALPFSYYTYNFFSGPDYDMYMGNETGIFGYNIGDQEMTPIMDFIASDFAGFGMNYIEIVDENTILASYFNEERTVVSKFTKIPADEVVEKTELTLGCYYLDWEVKKMVVEFNKKSTTHRIRIINYSDYNTADDYTAGLTRMNTDISSGNTPDIVLLQSEMPVDSYMSKGIFADYYQLIEEDPTFNIDEFLPNVFEAYQTGDKLFRMIPGFTINTFVGKTADVGEDYSWTMDEALALQASKPEGTNLFFDVVQTDFLSSCLFFGTSDYVNWETGECFFDSEEFIKMMEYAKTLPAEYAEWSEDESVNLERELQFRNGETLLERVGMSSFTDYSQWKYVTFGEDITMVGFPVKSGSGSTFSAGISLAISADSDNKQAAWEFVKSFLSEEYQDNMQSYFPVRISSLEKLEVQAWEKPYFTDTEGNKVEFENTYSIGGIEVKVDPMTKEETAVVMDFIKSINRAGTYNQDLNNIVHEEAAGFLAGQKSAKEVSDIIQSRARIYINENR